MQNTVIKMNQAVADPHALNTSTCLHLLGPSFLTNNFQKKNK